MALPADWTTPQQLAAHLAEHPELRLTTPGSKPHHTKTFGGVVGTEPPDTATFLTNAAMAKAREDVNNDPAAFAAKLFTPRNNHH